MGALLEHADRLVTPQSVSSHHSVPRAMDTWILEVRLDSRGSEDSRGKMPPQSGRPRRLRSPVEPRLACHWSETAVSQPSNPRILSWETVPVLMQESPRERERR